MELNVKTFATAIIGVVLMVLLTSAILVPVAESSTHNYYSNASNATEILDYVDGEDEYNLAKISDTFVLDGASIYSAKIYTDHGYIFASRNSVQGMIVFGDVKTTALTNVVNLESVTLTENEITVVIGGVTHSTELGWAYITNAYGAWGVVANDTETVYAKELNELKWIYKFSNNLAVMEGDNAYYQTQTFSDYMTVEELDDGVSVVTLPLTVSDSWTVSTPIVKLSVQSDAVDSPVTALVSIIPLLVFVGIALAAIGVFITRRD